MKKEPAPRSATLRPNTHSPQSSLVRIASRLLLPAFKTDSRVPPFELRHTKFPRPRFWPPSRFPRGIDYRLGADTAHRNPPMRRTAPSSTARCSRRCRHLAAAASQWRSRFRPRLPLATAIETGKQIRSNASFLSLGGGPLRGNNYTIDGVAMTTTSSNRAVANPTMEALDAGGCRCIPTMPRWGAPAVVCSIRTMRPVQTRCAALASSRRARSGGQVNNYFSELAGRLKPDSVYYLPRRNRRSDCPEQDVFLCRGRELPRRSVSQRLDGLSDGGRVWGRLLAPDECHGSAASPSMPLGPVSRFPATSSLPIASIRLPRPLLAISRSRM